MFLTIILNLGHKRRPHRQESNSSAMSANAESPVSGPMPVSVHRFSADSMNSSTSSSGLGTDIHSLRQSLPSPVLETTPTSHQNDQDSTKPLTKQPSRKSCKAVKETSPSTAKARRSSSKKKKNSCYSALGGSVLDQVDVRKT